MMCKVAVLNPLTQSVIYKTVSDKEISRAAGPVLDVHSIVQRNETSYGLFNNSAPRSSSAAPEYYALNGKLYHGTAVLYAFDREGKTLNMPRGHPQPQWLGSIENVDAALVMGMVDKPLHWC